MSYNPDWNRLDEIFAGDSKVQVIDTGAGQVLVTVDGVSVANFTVDGFQLASGARINEISTDGTLSDNSDDAVPTEKAVKTYVDSQIGGTTTNRIEQGDSYVEVTDTGSNGTISFVTDSNDIGSFTSSTQRIGDSETYITNDTSNARVTITSGINEVAYFGSTMDMQRIGPSSGARLEIDNNSNPTTAKLYGGNDNYLVIEQSSDGGATLRYFENAQEIIYADSSTITLGQDTSTTSKLIQKYSGSGMGLTLKVAGDVVFEALEATQTLGLQSSGAVITKDTNEVIIQADASNVIFKGTTSLVTVGQDNDTFISLDQANDQVVIRVANQPQVLVETTGTTIYDNLTVTGDLLIDGTTFTVHNQEVTTSDNIIVLNYGEPGAGVTAGQSGIEVDRGTLTNYQFLFDEPTDTFRVGEIGDLQAVATREDNPGSNRVPWWNNSENRFDTIGDTYITVDVSGNSISAFINTVSTFDLQENTQRFGPSSGTNVSLDQNTDVISFMSNGSGIATISSSGFALST
ncbi:MAG TPA: hypothetical protein EYP14_13105, partial [Planctomycetaceae bacterium]|nr:hypothetical protein [Planctomycetaceae bacterium]